MRDNGEMKLVGPDRSPSGPLVVVGDALLDIDLEGHADRLSPDAPVPVVDDIVERARPGGAALAATLAARDGEDVVLITPMADDEGAQQLSALLSGVVTVHSLRSAGSTVVKRRVRAGGQSIVRLDHGGRRGEIGPLSPEAHDALAAASAVLVSDYGRGTTAVPSVRTALRDVGCRLPVVWDPHPNGSDPVPGVRLLTPNRAEALAMARRIRGDGPGSSFLRDAADAAAMLAGALQARAVAVTLGAHGALLHDGAAAPVMAPAPPVTCVDACGAGDRFAAKTASLMGRGREVVEAVQRAVLAASEFVAAGGASRLSLELTGGKHEHADHRTPAERRIAAARQLVDDVHDRGGVVVATGGCFDLLHAGHVATLRAARALGDCLIVCLNSDESVRRLKGPQRPIVPADDRARVLEALACVDAVAIFDEDTPERLLGRLRPDVWAKGGDYAGEALPEAEAIRQWGGQAVVLPYVEGRSTSGLVREMARLSATAEQRRSK